MKIAEAGVVVRTWHAAKDKALWVLREKGKRGGITAEGLLASILGWRGCWKTIPAASPGALAVFVQLLIDG